MFLYGSASWTSLYPCCPSSRFRSRIKMRFVISSFWLLRDRFGRIEMPYCIAIIHECYHSTMDRGNCRIKGYNGNNKKQEEGLVILYPVICEKRIICHFRSVILFCKFSQDFGGIPLSPEIQYHVTFLEILSGKLRICYMNMRFFPNVRGHLGYPVVKHNSRQASGQRPKLRKPR